MKLKNKWVDIVMAIDCLLLFVAGVMISISLWNAVETTIDNMGLEGIFGIFVIVILFAVAIIFFIASFAFIPFLIFHIKNLYTKTTLDKISVGEKVSYFNFPACILLFICNIVFIGALIAGGISLIPSTIGTLTQEFSVEALIENTMMIITIGFLSVFLIFMEIYLFNKFKEEKALKLVSMNKTPKDIKIDRDHKYYKKLIISSIVMVAIFSVLFGNSIVGAIIDHTDASSNILMVLLFVGLLIYFVCSIFFYKEEETLSNVLINYIDENKNEDKPL